MSWRWQAPVYSPVSARSLLDGCAAASGLQSDHRATVAQELIERYDAIDAVLTDSGTSALILALRAVVRVRGTVALPGYGCVDLTSAAVGAQMGVRLYDLDPTTLSPDLESLRSAIARGVDAIVVAHLYGYPADVEAVRALAAPHGIPVIEDAAQGSGGTLHGRKLGSFGDAAILSFGRGKGMTAGSGGAVLVRTPALATWASTIHSQLGTPARGGNEIVGLAGQMLLAHPLLYRLPASVPALRLGEMIYKPPRAPRAMSRTAAAILASAIRTDEGEISQRRARANDIIARGARTSRLRMVHAVAGGQSGFLRLAFLDSRGGVLGRTSLGAVQGYPLTLDQHEPLRPLLEPNERAGNGSYLLRDRLFTIPTHSRVGTADASRLVKWLAAPLDTPAPGYST